MSTHWKKLTNPNYLGSYAFEKGKEKIVTIKTVRSELVLGADGKKEECTVAYFTENEKPLILNATNCKTIAKLYHTPFIEDWAGKRIQLYVTPVKAFGEVVDAVRIRPRQPAAGAKQTEAVIICADCGKKITAASGKSAEWIADYTEKKYGRKLCAECSSKLKESNKSESEDINNG